MAFSYLYPLREHEPPAPHREAGAAAERLPAPSRGRCARWTSRTAWPTCTSGVVEREDVIPQMAELSLQLEGAEWSAASGLVGDDLVVSVRNAGYQRAAGTVVKSLFGDVGSAGGHQAMAKAVIPLKAFRKKYGSTRSGRIKAVMIKGFLEEIECVTASSPTRR